MDKNIISIEDYDFIIKNCKIGIKRLEKNPTPENLELIKKYKAQILEAKLEMMKASQLNSEFAEKRQLRGKVDKETQAKINKFDDWIKKRDKTGNTKEIQFYQLKIHNLRMRLLKSTEVDEINSLINKIKTYKDQISELMEIRS